ncbi:hypothetical protein C2869_15125 [Saccharobesus litoralis]|uniref:Thioredoxin domain-containing protein n=1 Tax=Saccharobesus litoralis TaxID=2172099 RepID=A0A2S0VU01_9ALTE|nr:TlpA disulfide reductase family protein [Saccharobesus litoralis]AWB67688.1 hypothetical protein C2869_15125 [Saccharobesus litoralis]
MHLVKSIIKNSLVFVILFILVSWWQGRNLLNADDAGALKAIELPTLTGELAQVNFQQKVSVIYFFAPWCRVCDVSIDNLQALHETKGGDFNLVPIALDYSAIEQVSEFASRNELSMDVLLGTEQVKQKFKISGYPTYYVVDANGNITHSSMGYSTKVGLYITTMFSDI